MWRCFSESSGAWKLAGSEGGLGGVSGRLVWSGNGSTIKMLRVEEVCKFAQIRKMQGGREIEKTRNGGREGRGGRGGEDKKRSALPGYGRVTGGGVPACGTLELDLVRYLFRGTDWASLAR